MILRTVIAIVLISLLCTSDALAVLIACPEGQQVDSEFDLKAALQIEVPVSEQKEFSRALRLYAAQKDLNYWSGHMDWQTYFILHSKKSSVVLEVEIIDEDKIARVYLNRYCIPDRDDWRPYWVDFKAFVAANRYKNISNYDTVR